MITSLCDVLPGRTRLDLCTQCGHLFTPPLPDLTEYYRTKYHILVTSEDEDQLYELKDGRPVYRFDHQLDVLEAKVDLPAGAAVLDYGCAKGTTLRRLAERRPGVVPHLFDVSEIYRPFWDKFCPPEQTAVDRLPGEWAGRFDLALSFYALEHVEDPRRCLADVARALKPNGLLYLIVPNVNTNAGDFLVADHVNHFSRPSLRYALEAEGYVDVVLDDRTHRGAFVVKARRGNGPRVPPVDGGEVEAVLDNARRLAAYWTDFPTRVREFEAAHPALGPVAVYGSGFYGTVIATSLENPEAIRCFVDRNRYRWPHRLLGKPIVPPEGVPGDVRGLYAGLNPAVARGELAKIEAWKGRFDAVFYP